VAEDDAGEIGQSEQARFEQLVGDIGRREQRMAEHAEGGDRGEETRQPERQQQGAGGQVDRQHHGDADPRVVHGAGRQHRGGDVGEKSRGGDQALADEQAARRPQHGQREHEIAQRQGMGQHRSVESRAVQAGQAESQGQIDQRLRHAEAVQEIEFMAGRVR